MYGPIGGDIIGSTYEFKNKRTKNPDEIKFFPKGSKFTDDTVLTIATEDAILKGIEYPVSYKQWSRKYIDAGYGKMYKGWIVSDSYEPTNSLGNGSAMRVAPIAWAFDDLETILEESRKSAIATHNHIEAVRGAQAISTAIFFARKGRTKDEIKREIQKRFNYDLERKLADFRKIEKFDATCQGSVPQALIAFFEGKNFDDTARKAISIGGDSDTISCMACSIAEAHYKGVPEHIKAKVRSLLDDNLRNVLDQFILKYAPDYR